jgi:predicted ThiF/HesA family dinucleotide-utilizing enzyme
MTAPPLRPQGVVDEGVSLGHIHVATGEYIPDLEWPNSVTTYTQMRADPQIAAVLAAVGLPIRRSTWQVDPAGCRTRAARLVADSFGLPVAGRDDRPSGARVRGVTWSTVNRLGLLDLVWGHFPFEEWYEISGGLTRLAGLMELMPASIAELDVNRDGTLASVQQHGAPRDNPPIPANHLLWFAREREGANWQGRSMLRPAYASWILKREMLRAHAIGSRRFNHGVPVIHWDVGSDPTPAQIQDAARFASAMRAGDQAGGSPPPGARVELVGISGGVPDTLAFIRYLDQQISRMALAGMLDLGETPNGSRALGAEFVDLFLLALQAHADEHAATVTEQTVARLVGYNWGDAEPVPPIVVADVGSKREVTVEALQLLLASGAVRSDPGLERWVRSEWRLPVVEQVPPMPTPPAPGGAPAPPPGGDASGG